LDKIFSVNQYINGYLYIDFKSFVKGINGIRLRPVFYSTDWWQVLPAIQAGLWGYRSNAGLNINSSE